MWWSYKNVMPQQCLMQILIWICRRECNHMMVQMKISCECKCPLCGCKCLFLECLMQKFLFDMQTWTQSYNGAFENFLWCNYLPGRCICEFYARDANVWNINQLYHFQTKLSKPLTSIRGNSNHHSSFHSWCGLKTHCNIFVQKADYLV